MRKTCSCCRKKTENWQKINGGGWHCFDGCFSTTGQDNRTVDRHPAWLPYQGKPAWDPARMCLTT